MGRISRLLTRKPLTSKGLDVNLLKIMSKMSSFVSSPSLTTSVPVASPLCDNFVLPRDYLDAQRPRKSRTCHTFWTMWRHSNYGRGLGSQARLSWSMTGTCKDLWRRYFIVAHPHIKCLGFLWSSLIWPHDTKFKVVDLCLAFIRCACWLW